MKLGKETLSLEKPVAVWATKLTDNVFECFAADDIIER